MARVGLAPPLQVGTHPVRMGSRLPPKAIPLVEATFPPPAPETNVVLYQASHVRTFSLPELVGYADAQGRLLREDGGRIWEGGSFWVTDRQDRGRWLFGRYVLRYPIASAVEDPENVKTLIRLSTADGQAYSEPHRLEVFQDDRGRWRAQVWLGEPYQDTGVRVVYSALTADGATMHEESAVPQAGFERVERIEDVSDGRYYQGATSVPWQSLLVVSAREQPHDRPPLVFRFRLHVDGIADGRPFHAVTPWRMSRLFDPGDAAAQLDGRRQVDGSYVLIRDVDAEAAAYAPAPGAVSAELEVLDASGYEVQVRLEGEGENLGALRAWVVGQGTRRDSDGFRARREAEDLVAEVELIGQDGAGQILFSETLVARLSVAEQGTTSDAWDPSWVAVRSLEVSTLPPYPGLHRLTLVSRHPRVVAGFRSSDPQDRRLRIGPDGEPALDYAELSGPTARFEVVVAAVGGVEYLAPRMAVRALDRAPLSVRLPGYGPEASWYVQVLQGGFARLDTGEDGAATLSYYTLPSLWAISGIWTVEDEPAAILDASTVVVAHFPLVIRYDETGQFASPVVRRNGQIVPVEAVDCRIGQIRLRAHLDPADDVRVDYRYFGLAQVYEGFEQDGRWHEADFNPLPGHLLSMDDEYGTSLDMPASRHFLQPVPLWALPAAKAALTGKMIEEVWLSGGAGSVTVHELAHPALARFAPWTEPFDRDITLFFCDEHGLALPADVQQARFVAIVAPEERWGSKTHIAYRVQLDEPRLVAGSTQAFVVRHGLDPRDPSAVLLGEVVVRPHLLPHHVELTDRRRRGGGLVESLSPERDQALFDAGTLDGQVLLSSGVVLLRVGKPFLADPQRGASEGRVREAFRKYAAFGHLPVIVREEVPRRILERPGPVTARPARLVEGIWEFAYEMQGATR